jgi:hypothetical protein
VRMTHKFLLAESLSAPFLPEISLFVEGRSKDRNDKMRKI